MKKNKNKLFLTTEFIGLVFIFLTSAKVVSAAQCGEWANGQNGDCNCPEVNNQLDYYNAGGGTSLWCCGTIYNGKCRDPQDIIDEQEQELENIEQEIEENSVNVPKVNSDTLNKFNPLTQYSSKANDLSTPGGIITEVLNFAFPIAGIILFLMILFGGLKMLTGAANESKLKEGQQMIVSAIVGFIILFAAYWIATLLEMIFGISILS